MSRLSRVLCGLLIIHSLRAWAGGGTTLERPTEQPVVVGQEFSLPSRVLGEKQEVMIYVPPQSENRDQRWPVIYVLDGEYTFLHTVSATQFLAAQGNMPPAIVVGVNSNNRLRDFTPALTTPDEEFKVSGGADRYLQFLHEELIPYVNQHYPVASFRVLVGHSLGGLFATHAMINRPELFQGIVTLEPALWWDDRIMVNRVEHFFQRKPLHPPRLIMVEGNSVEGWKNDWPKIAPKLPADLHWELLSVPNESHEGMAFRGRFEGLKALFKDYVPQMRHDASRASLPALEEQYQELTSDYGFDVAIPEFALLEVAQRSANREDYQASVETLERAAELYPSSDEVLHQLERMRVKAATAPPVSKKRVSSFAAVEATSPFVGRWEGTLKTDPGVPSEIVVVLKAADGQLQGHMIARGLAADGGDFRMEITGTRLLGDQLEWDRPDNNGGTHIHVAHLNDADTLAGEVFLKGGGPLPRGFVPPKVTFSLRKANSPGD